MDYNNYDPNNNSQPPMQAPGQHPKKGMCIASLVLGIISLALFCAWYLSIPCAILAIIFSILATKAGKNGMATAGLVMGIIGLILGVIIAILVLASIGSFSQEFGKGFMDALNSSAD